MTSVTNPAKESVFTTPTIPNLSNIAKNISEQIYFGGEDGSMAYLINYNTPGRVAEITV